MKFEDLTFQQKLCVLGKTLLAAVKPLLLYILMPALSMSVGYAFLHKDMTAQEFFSYGGNFYTALGMGLTLLILYLRSRKKGHRFFEDATLYLENPDKKKLAGFFLFGITAAVTVSAVLTLLPRWGVTNAYSEASQTMFKGRDIVFTVLTTVVTGPLVEEVVFRGYMLNTFLENMGERWAILWVSAIFAVCHGEALWILYAFAMGAVFAWVSIKEDNILYTVVMHVGFNLPSAVTWLIRSIPSASALFYENKWLILGYGLISGLLSALLIRLYRRGRG